MNILKIDYNSLKDLDFEKNIIHKEENIYYGIFFQDRIFGYIVLNCEEDLSIEYIYINEVFRNNGYGSKLLNYAIYDSINLEFNKVIVKNHKALNNFLEKNGFIRYNEVYVQNNIKNEIEELILTSDLSKKNLFLNIVLATFKILTGFIFKINVLLVDGINSFSDLINNILVIVAINIDKKPSDEDHPFGHGKIEAVFSLIIGIIIIITSLEIVKSSVISLIKNQHSLFNINKIVILVSLFMIIIKIMQYIYLYCYSKNKNNQLLKTLIIDYYLDILLSSLTFLGIILSKYVDSRVDSILSIILSFYLIYKGYEIVKENTLILMDSQDEKLLLNIKVLTLEITEIINVHDLYMTKIGNNIYVMADIRMDGNISLEKAHKISEIAEKRVKYVYPNVKKVIYHIEPVY